MIKPNVKQQIILALHIFTAAAATLAIVLLFGLISQGNDLLKQGNEQVTEANRNTEASLKHTDCIADLFARYTRDNKPITIEDLNACKSIQASPSQPAPSSPKQTPQSPPPIPQTNTPNTPPKSNELEGLVDCKVDVLFIHVGCKS